MRSALRNNNTFLTEMDQTLGSLQKDTKLRSRLLESLNSLEDKFTSQRIYEENDYNKTVIKRLEQRKKD